MSAVGDNTNQSMTKTQDPPLASHSSSSEIHNPPSSFDSMVHFDKTTSKWQFEDDDGREYEWIESKQTWVPLLDESLLEAQQAAYKVDGVDENIPVIEKKDKKQLKLEKQLQKKTNQKKRALDQSNPTGSGPPQRNTAIYVTRLPLDTTVEELQSCFSKAGLILVNDEGQPKIKLYTDTNSGVFNGSALVVFLKSESVDLAIRLFDDISLRLTPTGTDQDRMQVSRAEFSHKTSTKETQFDHRRELQQKQKRAKKVEKLKSKLEEWDSEDESTATQNLESKFSKVVVLQHMFTLEELESDPSLLLDLKEDVREECELLGNVTNVTLYDLEPEGIMTVKFKEPIAAQACIVKMNNRFFAGRQVKAFLYNGKIRYKKTGHASNMIIESDSNGNTELEEKKRLEAFAKFLEEQ